MRIVFYCFCLLLWRGWDSTSGHSAVHMRHESTQRKDPEKTPTALKPMKDFSFASYYGDHMVLQRAPQRATVWGYHPDPGIRIILQVKGRKIYSAIVNENGVWKVLLDPETSPGPFHIVAYSETKAIQLEDVLFGDVWLCSGQSNMVFTLDAALNGSKEIKEAEKFKQIRVFTSARHYSKQPLPDLEGVLENWSLPDNGENDANVLSYRNNYNCTFPAMIEDWRRKFSAASGGQTKPDFPFGFVQIGAFYKDSVISSGFPDIRWHQTADYGYVPNPRMKNVFMSVTMDITDFSSPFGPVHTRDKEDITHRLFLGGLSVAYGIKTLWQGPLPLYVTHSGDTLILDYGKRWTLELRQQEGFELCCSLDAGKSCKPSEGKAWWVPTPIMISNATHIQVYAGVCGDGQNILGLRYAWRLSPCPFKQCAVYSQENALPGPPFVVYVNNLSSKNTTFTLDWDKQVHL